MAKMKAIRDFGGSTINREDLGIVRNGDEIEVSANDAQYLEREGYAEPVIDGFGQELAPAAAAEPSGIESEGDPAAKPAPDASKDDDEKPADLPTS